MDSKDSYSLLGDNQIETNFKSNQMIKNVLFICCIMMLATSCGKDKETQDCGLFSSVELGERLAEVGNAATALSEEATTQNCDRYKSAWSAYLNTAESLLDCSFIDRADLDMNISEARAAIAQEDCNL